jgi:phosphoribosylformylglycinamidine synthase
MLGEDRGELGGSEYLNTVHGIVRGDIPELDLAREAALQKLVVGAIADGLLQSAHDCSDGGAAITLAECCFDTGGVGVTVELATELELFSESASRIVVSVAASKEQELLSRASAAGVPARRIGVTGGDRLKISAAGSALIDIAISEAERIWSTAIERYFTRAAA